MLTLESASIQGKRKRFERKYSASTWDGRVRIDARGRSALAFEREKKDGMRGCTDLLLWRRDKTSLDEEHAARAIRLAEIVENSAKWIAANLRLIPSDFYVSRVRMSYYGC